MGINYRCMNRPKCGKRVTLNKAIWRYVKWKVCTECGSELVCVNHKEKERNKLRGCFCKGNYWPHNKGAIVDENYTCDYADPKELEDFQFNFGLNISETNKNCEECPF